MRVSEKSHRRLVFCQCGGTVGPSERGVLRTGRRLLGSVDCGHVSGMSSPLVFFFSFSFSLLTTGAYRRRSAARQCMCGRKSYKKKKEQKLEEKKRRGGGTLGGTTSRLASASRSGGQSGDSEHGGRGAGGGGASKQGQRRRVGWVWEATKGTRGQVNIYRSYTKL